MSDGLKAAYKAEIEKALRAGGKLKKLPEPMTAAGRLYTHLLVTASGVRKRVGADVMATLDVPAGGVAAAGPAG